MADQLYKIGKVSELTGLSVERLRMWEQRHEIRPTKKVNRIRFYDDDQLEKLTLIKELIDRGFSIGELKELSVKELKPLLGRPMRTVQSSDRAIVVVGDMWNFEEPTSTSNYDVVARFLSLESFCDWSAAELHVNFDALVVLVSSLDIEKIDDATTDIDVPVFVIYKYASEADLELARDASIFVAKMQATNWSEVVATIEERVATTEDTFTDFRIFDDEQLEHLRRCKTNERVEPENFVEIVYLQQAIIDHLSRTTNNGWDIALVEQVKVSQNAMEQVLRSIADKHQLFV